MLKSIITTSAIVVLLAGCDPGPRTVSDFDDYVPWVLIGGKLYGDSFVEQTIHRHGIEGVVGWAAASCGIVINLLGPTAVAAASELVQKYGLLECRGRSLSESGDDDFNLAYRWYQELVRRKEAARIISGGGIVKAPPAAVAPEPKKPDAESCWLTELLTCKGH